MLCMDWSVEKVGWPSMLTLALLSWIIPALIGIASGYLQARAPATTPADFGKDFVYMLMMAAPVIFIFHMLWLASVMMADGGVTSLGRWAWYWSWLTALIWVPCMVISYIIRAMRARR